MTFTTTSVTPQIQRKQQQCHVLLLKRRKERNGRANFKIKKYPLHIHLLAYIIVLLLICLSWLPDFIVALKDVSVTIPQAVKRGSNAMLTCNYDMENDTLYSVKWYKGRREFYRYTPKENPAMKVFPSQSGLNVERNLSNQSHVVLLAVPLNISGKFTCEISVEAPSFQTAMVSGEMEVVELPEEQATVTGIQPRYRIGDLVDGNCSIKYSKPAANLTWTINGLVVPPHHIKTYQIEKYEESNLESVMSVVHFMVTTQHFIKGQMRLKCTANIFDIFKEEIESIIEEDRPRIMASGQSYPPDHGYGTHGDSEGYEHNESYLTYFSAPKSSASPTADFVLIKVLKFLKQKVFKNIKLLMPTIKSNIQYDLPTILVNNLKSNLAPNNSIKTKTFHSNVLQPMLIRLATTALFVLVMVALIQMVQHGLITKSLKSEVTHDRQMSYDCIEKLRRLIKNQREIFLSINLWHEAEYKNVEGEIVKKICYQDAIADDCQTECECQHQYQYEQHSPVANQNIVSKKVFPNDTNINAINKNANTIVTLITTDIDCQHHMSQTVDLSVLPPTSCALIHSLSSLKSTLTSSLRSSASSLSASSSSSPSSSSLSLSSTLRCRRTCALDSIPSLYAMDASKSNNAKYMSKDQTIWMTFRAAAANSIVVAAPLTTLDSIYKTPNVFAPIAAAAVAATATTRITSTKALALEPELLQTSVHATLAVVAPSSLYLPMFSRNKHLMAFIGELLFHRC